MGAAAVQTAYPGETLDCVLDYTIMMHVNLMHCHAAHRDSMVPSSHCSHWLAKHTVYAAQMQPPCHTSCLYRATFILAQTPLMV